MHTKRPTLMCFQDATFTVDSTAVMLTLFPKYKTSLLPKADDRKGHFQIITDFKNVAWSSSSVFHLALSTVFYFFFFFLWAVRRRVCK